MKVTDYADCPFVSLWEQVVEETSGNLVEVFCRKYGWDISRVEKMTITWEALSSTWYVTRLQLLLPQVA